VFCGERTAQSYVSYRHVSAVLPILVLLALHGAAHGPRPARILGGLLVVAGVWGGAMALVEAPPVAPSRWRATGWILGSKLGHDPPRLEDLLRHIPEQDRAPLAFGYGWGIAATLLAPATPPAPEAVGRVAVLANAFSPLVRPRVVEGIEHAFAQDVTPALEPSLLRDVLNELRVPGHDSR
jgi:hypothetical protein